jgi:hypothetical protein
MDQLEVGLVEGWKGPVDFRLRSDGEIQDLTGYTVIGELYDRNGSVISATDDVGIVSATGGRVKLTPDTEDFRVSGSPYSLRFKATLGGEDVYFPSEEPICITVRR